MATGEPRVGEQPDTDARAGPLAKQESGALRLERPGQTEDKQKALKLKIRFWSIRSKRR